MGVPPLHKSSLYCEAVTATMHIGLGFSKGGQKISFGDSPQDICSELGPPSHTAMKGPEVLKTELRSRPADYYYTYLDR